MRNFPSTLSLTANSAAAIQALNAALAEWMPASDRRILTRRARLAEQAKSAAAPAPPPAFDAITPEWISACIAEAVGDDAIIVNEYPLRLAHCRREQPGSYFGLSPAGGLGWGFGAALGVKLAAPERLVVATLGDGAYIFANPPACHFVSQAYDIPVLVVIFNNQFYGAVRNATRAMYAAGEAMKAGGRLLADLSPAPAYERYAEASGGYGERVERAADLPAALRRAIHAVTVERRQALLNVISDY
jgi:acetolactate synthase-1/2/3 large subunit